jgi:phage terminase small subunit
MATSPTHAALTDRQRAFIREYLKNGGNGSQAAIAAGYSKAGAAVAASRMLLHPTIAAAIREGSERQNGRVEGIVGSDVLSPERVLTETAYIAYSDPLQALDDGGMPRAPKEIPESTRRAISKIKVRVDNEGASIVEFTFWDKTKGLEMLGKRLGLFRDKVEVTGEGGEPLQIVVQTYKEGGET